MDRLRMINNPHENGLQIFIVKENRVLLTIRYWKIFPDLTLLLEYFSLIGNYFPILILYWKIFAILAFKYRLTGKYFTNTAPRDNFLFQ
jgi:hypothetical protein